MSSSADRLLEDREVRAAAADDADAGSVMAGHGAQPMWPAASRARASASPRVADAPSRGPSSGARTPSACRTGAGARRGPRAPRRCRSACASRGAPSPSRLTIATAGARMSTEPSGSPQIARTCCSNWLVSRALDRPVAAVVHPRGQLVDDERAVRHEEQLDRQRADEAHRGRQAHGEFAAASRRPRATPAGTTLSTRIPRSCRFRATGNVRPAPSTLRAHDHRQLRLERRAHAPAGPATRPGRRAPRSRPCHPMRAWLRPS